MSTSMTPFRTMKGFESTISSDADMSMDADESHCSESMISSPPKKSTLQRNRPRHSGASFASRLFEDDEDDKLDSNQGKGVLKPLDLNLELEGSSASSTDRKPAARKRQAENHIGKDLSFEDIDSPVDIMHESPRMSPSCYRSPAHRHVPLKSPNSFRTLDGRTVQSKNPFSPMVEETGGSGTPRKMKPVDLGDSLNFPVSLEDKKEEVDSSGLPNVAPLIRHRLHKRPTLLDPTTFQKVSYHFNSFTRDGYPERQGRFSFTGSPIREMETAARQTEEISRNKVRRLHEGDDVVAAASHEPPQYRQRKPLDVDTMVDNPCGYTDPEEVSPTDVLSFPMGSPPSSPGVPPTPSKPKHDRRRVKTRYTPVRKSTVPQTPIPERRFRSRSFDEDDDRDNSLSPRQTQQPHSRFYSDFDVISELGNGSFGNVFKVLSRLDGCMYAIKVAHRPAKGNADKDRMLKEVYALAALSDQAETATFHIVRYHQAWMEDHRLYIQTELCTSTLTEEMSHGRLTVQRRYKFAREICLALEFIHKNGMVHLDIKPENIFIKNDQFKLGDFGLVSKVSSHDVEEGDSRYMSIELLSGDHDDLTKSDIFSLGITLYEVCLGGPSLPTNGDHWQSLRSGNIPLLRETPIEMHRLIQQMMNPTYASRPSASELLKRPQLLSEEQKAFLAERNKVVQANLALAEQRNRLRMLNGNNLNPSMEERASTIPTSFPAAPRPKGMVRASTWDGS